MVDAVHGGDLGGLGGRVVLGDAERVDPEVALRKVLAELDGVGEDGREDSGGQRVRLGEAGEVGEEKLCILPR